MKQQRGILLVWCSVYTICVSLLRRHRLSIIGQNFLQAKNLTDFLKYVNNEMPAEEAISVYFSLHANVRN
jgi:hypothetical protein